ncbi:serine protease persephone isoform X2 [Zeugodacus cucurbitae]|uniref:Serine protease persephone n=1 Tax=Zeugodacus cucurbitae TaxID=28588 RepID=A0A0A1X3R3_ZEUCU|nr:serine protease persephone isoform X2 [Zeugodacus cucurbitae]
MPSMKMTKISSLLSSLLVLLLINELCAEDTEGPFIIYMDVRNDIENLIQWGNTCEEKLTTIEKTVVETIESSESSNGKYLEILKKVEYLENLVSAYERKQHAMENVIQRIRPVPEREHTFKTPSTTAVQRNPTQLAPPPNKPAAGNLASQACEDIEKALQSQGIRHSITEIHPALAIIGKKSRYSYTYRCTGALIGKRFVLATGRCLSTGGANLVRLGNRSDKTSVMETNIKKVHVHPKYASKKNNIGVAELESDVNYSSLVYPSCLYTAATISLTNTEISYTSYPDEFLSQTLLEVRGQLVPYSNCAQFGDADVQDKYADSLICVLSHNASHTYFGSSHGPIFYTRKDGVNKERIIAVDSESTLQNGVYLSHKLIKVYDYLDFIESVMRG